MNENLSAAQFPSVLRANQVLDYAQVNPEEVDGNNPDELLTRKLTQANKKGLTKSLLTEGVRSPIKIFHGHSGKKYLVDGHHRLAVLLKHAPDTELQIEHIR